MTNVKISPKGRVLLGKGNLASKIVSAVVKGGTRLSTQAGYPISINGRAYTIKEAGAKNNG